MTRRVSEPPLFERTSHAMPKAEVKWDEERGVWYARPYLGTNQVTGKPLRPYRSFPTAHGRYEAQVMCDRWLAGLVPEIGLHVGRTVTEIASAYVSHLAASGVATSTVRAYRSVIDNHLSTLSTVDVDELKPYAVEGMYAVMLAQGGRYGTGLAPSTIGKVHWLLSGMYRWAVRIGAASGNPMPSVRRPKPIPHEAVAYDEAQMRVIADALIDIMSCDSADKAARFLRNVALAAYSSLRTGARCGEALSMPRKNSVGRRGGRSVRIDSTIVEDPVKGVFRQGFTKGKKARNLSVVSEDMEIFRAHVAWQDGTYIGSPCGSLPLCCVDDVSYMRPSKVSAAFSDIRDRLGLPKDTSFHTLRHTHATWLLYQGMDIRTVMERLGHAKITTTLELYAHVLPGRDEQAAEAFAAAMRGDACEQ